MISTKQEFEKSVRSILDRLNDLKIEIASNHGYEAAHLCDDVEKDLNALIQPLSSKSGRYDVLLTFT